MDKIQKSKKTFTFVNFMLEYMTVFLNITSKEETKLSSPVDIRENSEEEKEKVSQMCIRDRHRCLLLVQTMICYV